MTDDDSASPAPPRKPTRGNAKCKVCQHAQRGEIEAAMARGIGKRKVGELFGLSLARGKLQQTAIFGAFRRPVSVAHFQCPDGHCHSRPRATALIEHARRARSSGNTELMFLRGPVSHARKRRVGMAV
jgi:hypothetical protein